MARLGTGPALIRNGATLAGKGSLNGAVAIQSGGTLAPGAGAIGTLTVNGILTLAGATVMELEKKGTALTSDLLTGMSSVTYGGSLVVTNIGDVRTGALAPGETFHLFEAASCAGAFASLQLPDLSPGLTWDTNNLALDGTLTVIEIAKPPLITMQPQNLTVSQGTPVTLKVAAAGEQPLNYQWWKNAAPLAGATAASLASPNPGTNDSGPYTVVVANPYGSITSAVANLAVLPAGVPTPVTNGLVVYLNFDNNILAQGGTTNSGTIYTGGATLGPRYRAGMIAQAATFANAAAASQPNDWALSLGNLDWIYANSFSVSFWQRTLVSGDDALMGNKDWTSGANAGWVISALDSKNLNYNAAGGTRRDIDLQPPFSDGNWHLVTITFNRTANQVISYLDGVALMTSDVSPSGAASLSTGFNTLIGSTGNGSVLRGCGHR